jgi:hypothetical protein
MIRELIELAEEMYARGHSPSQSPAANGEDFKTFAIRLGHQIEEVGHALRRYQERIEQQSFYIKRLENQIKEMRDDHSER